MLHFFGDKNKSSPAGSSASGVVTPAKFYLNIFFLDRRELVRNIIRSKVSRNRPVIRALAKRAAVALLKDGISEKVGSVLCEMLPNNVRPMGIESNASVVYRHKSYLCLEVKLTNVDIPTLAAFNGGATAGDAARNIMRRFSCPMLDAFAASWLLQIFRTKLIAKMGPEVKFKLFAKMNAEVEAIACSEEELGPLLISIIHQLDISGATAGARNAASDAKQKNDYSDATAVVIEKGESKVDKTGQVPLKQQQR